MIDVRVALLIPFLAVALTGLDSEAGELDCGDIPGFFFLFEDLPGDSTTDDTCSGNGFRCEEPAHTGTTYQLKSAACDPQAGPCEVQMRVHLTFTGNKQNLSGGIAPTPLVFWFTSPTAPASCDHTFPPDCGQVSICGLTGQEIRADFVDTYTQRGGVTCDNADTLQDDFSLIAFSCPPTGSCLKLKAVNNLVLGGAALKAGIGCPLPPDPPPSSCGGDESCAVCLPGGGGGGASAGGGGGSFGGSGEETGPGATLRYRAGGAGFDPFPGAAAHRAAWGLGWSHEYAMRIVEDPDETRVWLITPFATFRKFMDLATGTYGTASPSDECRTLTWSGSGWELRELSGTVHSFDANGLWTRTLDRNGNATTAAYAVDQLVEVDFPDGRSETFSYHPSGKLATITEVGVPPSVGSSDELVWSYTWTGDELSRIDRPDGTALEFFYEDGNFPGYLTRVELVDTDGTLRRVEAAWQYDASGNVEYLWRGDASRLGPNAIEVYGLQFDDPEVPAETVVTDPLNTAATYTIERDDRSTKPRLTEVSGDCPICGLAPNTQLAYDDPDHPLLPTSEVDGEGNMTVMSYDSHGQMVSRIEAMASPRERETTWEYHSTFNSFPTSMRMPSTTGGGGFRETLWSYDPATGDLTTRTLEGVENGSTFSYSTFFEYDPSGSGASVSVDPPGYLQADVTSFVNDPDRGHLLPLSRTDPLVGTSTFEYDGFNRRTAVADPNGVRTETSYDPLDRVEILTRKGDGASVADLVTVHQYNTFGDLFRTILPRQNVIEYGYDAAGRLISVERKPDAATPGERTFYTLDDLGHRIREDLQVWDSVGGAWVTRSFTEYEYSTRCYLDKIHHADGSVTEYAYDCNGNLSEVWDPNNPNTGATTPTTMYGYDELDRLTQVDQQWGGAGGGFAGTSYVYDVQDHLIEVTDAEGNTTSYTYGDRDLVTEEVSPVSGTTTFAYNEHGELEVETDARGVVTTRTIDELDRVTEVSYPDASLDVTYTYDDPLVAFSRGRLTRIGRHATGFDYTYDRFGRVLQDGPLTYAYLPMTLSTSFPPRSPHFSC